MAVFYNLTEIGLELSGKVLIRFLVKIDFVVY